MAVIGFLILIFVGLFFGAIKYPTQSDLILILSATALFIMTWLNQRDKNAIKEEEKLKEKKKIQPSKRARN